jgi:hypothetical protein
MSRSDSGRVTERAISELLSDLPPESLAVLKQFVEFLREQAQRGQPVVSASGAETHPYRYPTSSLRGWGDVLTEGYDGNALADSEALYDEA